MGYGRGRQATPGEAEPSIKRMPVKLSLSLSLGLLALAALLWSGCTYSLRPRIECSGEKLEACLGAQTLLEPLTKESCEGREKRVCFVPLGQVSPELVENLVDYYHREYAYLTIQIVRPLTIPSEMVNADRQQVEASSLSDYMNSQFHYDPDAVLIGLTPVDLYWSDKNWRYTFGVREAGRWDDLFGVVSYARMDPRVYGLRENEDLLYSRVRKLVSKYIGIMYYDLSDSSDPSSPLYNNILSPSDLDRMQEPLPIWAAR